MASNPYDICFIKTDARWQNLNAVTEAEPASNELLQQAIITFSRMENQDDDVVKQGDEEEEQEKDEEGDDNLDIDGARSCYCI